MKNKIMKNGEKMEKIYKKKREIKRGKIGGEMGNKRGKIGKKGKNREKM